MDEASHIVLPNLFRGWIVTPVYARSRTVAWQLIWIIAGYERQHRHVMPLLTCLCSIQRLEQVRDRVDPGTEVNRQRSHVTYVTHKAEKKLGNRSRHQTGWCGAGDCASNDFIAIRKCEVNGRGQESFGHHPPPAMTRIPIVRTTAVRFSDDVDWSARR